MITPGVAHATPPSNDDFDASAAITTLPFTAQLDRSEATKALDDPATCNSWNPEGSVWFHHTATEDGFLRAGTAGSDLDVKTSAFTGDRGDLRPVASGCSVGPTSPMTIRVTAGQTYRFMVTDGYNGRGATTNLSVQRMAPLANDDFANAQPLTSLPASTPAPDFSLATFQPDEPSATACRVTEVLPPSTDTSKVHRYTADGNYTVTVRASTQDGRTTTDTTTVVVKTHDVGIAKFTVPASARAGQQKPISVQVSNTRYLEKNVTVVLYRYGDFGWVEVGQQKLDVPAHPTRKVTFPFAYTFTPEDAVRGKATFRAVVSLPYPTQDALPLDNEAISTATTVRPAATVNAVAN